MNSASTELVTTPEASLATVPHSQPLSVANMLSAVIDKGVSSENVGALEKLVDLYERMEVRNAEKEFAAAFVALQAEMPTVNMSKAVPDKFGNVKYHYAPYEEIMATVRPILLKHGFTVTFSMTFGEGRVTQECTLTHVGGHSRKNQFMCRIGNGPPGSSEAQGDGAASTYAKRFALCNALNIVTERDTDGQKLDARFDGAPITREQAQVLREMVRDTGSDEAKFLSFAGAPTYEQIGANRYQEVFAILNKKGARR